MSSQVQMVRVSRQIKPAQLPGGGRQVAAGEGVAGSRGSGGNGRAGSPSFQPCL